MKCTSHPLAQRDLLEAIAYYDERALGLGAELLSTFEQTVALIRRHPQVAPLVRGELRRLVMPRFPYNIIYRIAGDTIRVLAVTHQKRSPDYWKTRV